MSTSTPALRRADSAIGKYKTNHPHLPQNSPGAKSCGRCMKHEVPAPGSSKHKILGFVCIACTSGTGTKK